MSVPQVIFHGTKAEASELVACFANNCTCSQESSFVCSGHKSMVEEQRFMDGLIWMHRIREQLLSEEACTYERKLVTAQ